ncbi:MAG TPA: hypothetical protein DEO70_12155 [Bacteroidales bacterium]|nr:MAG: hypothetical protein A2X11_10145 [Bacteroidetes bacterium GWE2_42_24]OFY25871.1 MAG: hypothetical protein A2X09_09520 [Bacteroidetes bacterium GWF2_43_11]HBZ67581.1 hypothetical protein [Bacteroidales bacterium]
MNKQEFVALVADKLTVTNPGDITAQKIKDVFDTLASIVFDEIKMVNHVEAATGTLTADVPTDIEFSLAFSNTEYAIAYRALDALGQKVDCTIVKYANKITVTALESDVTFDFIASRATISLEQPT